MNQYEAIRQSVIAIEGLSNDATVIVNGLTVENDHNGYRTVTFSYKTEETPDDQDLWNS